jgi:spermidine synthase
VDGDAVTGHRPAVTDRTSAFFRKYAEAAEGDFSPGADPARRARKLSAIVGLTAMTALMLELLLARLLPFFLGNVSAFLAIPVAMFGLALGALSLHFSPRDPDPERLPGLVVLLLICTAGGLIFDLLLFNHVLGLIHYSKQNPLGDAVRTMVLSTACVPAFAVAGVVLSTAFSAGADRIGRLYSLDLIGSAGACLLAPVLLHVLDLPIVLVALLACQTALVLYVLSSTTKKTRKRIVVGFVILATLAGFHVVFTAKPDPTILAGRHGNDAIVEEARHRWNEISRVALLRIEKASGAMYWIVHDDGISNSRVLSYSAKKVGEKPRLRAQQGLPFLLDDVPKTALVMFAGAGQDMIQLHRYADGDMDITGVEIQPLVVDLSRGVMGFGNSFGLREFYDLPNIDMHLDEGRSFLDRHPEKYDLIFVASNGSQHASRTGHSRKFLDTREAMAAYLDRLNPGGTILFNVQNVDHKFEIFKRLLEERGHARFADAAIILGRTKQQKRRFYDTLILKPSGFSEREVERITEARTDRSKRRRWVKYAPGFEGSLPEAVALATAPPDLSARIPVDDQPFEAGIDFSAFDWSPTPKMWKPIEYRLDWVKTFTLGFFGILALLTVLALQLRSRGGLRLPLTLTAWFLGSGVAYMLAQVGLMAKLELFMGLPIYSIAVVLAGFLLANGAGSAWVGQRRTAGRPLSPVLLAGAAAVLVFVTPSAVDALNAHAIHLPTVVKVIPALLVVAPLAFVLGTFYPLGVGLAVERGLGPLVPMTFGLATISSVAGSTYAMIAVINAGFTSVIQQAIPVYLGLAVVALALGLNGRLGRKDV